MTTRPIALVWALVLVAPASVHADAISPPPPCPAGQERGGGLLGSLGGLYGHGGLPPCEPAACRDASVCGAGQVCRRDAHCIEARTTRELRRSPGHGAPRLDPSDPSSYEMVTRHHDRGRCGADGACPGEARCLTITTCRDDAVDGSPVAGSAIEPGLDALLGPASQSAWAYGAPFDPSVPLGPIGDVVPPAEEPAEEPAPPSPPPPVTPPPAPAPSSCACRAAPRRAPRALVLVALVGLALPALRRSRSRARR